MARCLAARFVVRLLIRANVFLPAHNKRLKNAGPRKVNGIYFLLRFFFILLLGLPRISPTSTFNWHPRLLLSSQYKRTIETHCLCQRQCQSCHSVCVCIFLFVFCLFFYLFNKILNAYIQRRYYFDYTFSLLAARRRLFSLLGSAKYRFSCAFFSSSLILFDNVDISLEEVGLISVYFQQKSHELLSMLCCGEGINSTLREGKVFLPSSAIPYVNKCDWIGIFKWNRVCSGVWVLVWKMIEKTNNIYIFFNIFLFLFFSHIY